MEAWNTEVFVQVSVCVTKSVGGLVVEDALLTAWNYGDPSLELVWK